MKTEKTIRWTQPMLERFRKAYKQAVLDKKDTLDTFVFDENVFVVGYAKYLIEYLDTRFKGQTGFGAGSVVTGGGK